MVSSEGKTDASGVLAQTVDDALVERGSGAVVIVDAPAHALVISLIQLWVKDSETTPEPLQLQKAENILVMHGNVQDYGDTPVGGAPVKVVGLTEGNMFPWHINGSNGGLQIPELTTVTNKDGFFELRPFVLDSYSQLMHVSLASSVSLDHKLCSGEQTIWARDGKASIKLRPTFAVAGTIFDTESKKGIANAKVRLWTEPASVVAASLAPAVTDKHGHFKLTAVPAATSLLVGADHSDYMPGDKKVLNLSLEHPVPIDGVELRLVPLVSVSGRVIDEISGKPLVVVTKGAVDDDNMRIEAEFKTEGMEQPQKTTADVRPDGSFDFRLPVGENQLVLYCNGYEWSIGKWKIGLNVSSRGEKNLVLRVAQKIGTMVSFESSNPDHLSNYWLEQKDGPGWRREWIKARPQFFGWNGTKWGDKIVFRVVRKDTGEVVLPEQEIAADPKNWLVTVSVP
jgi:hypothetical protein